ncbi:MAG: hypothetical protein KDD70_14970 [Bdellovibrionales bacterium]|nr:hypothetical protein [Bdellovibrionales bacterium]
MSSVKKLGKSALHQLFRRKVLGFILVATVFGLILVPSSTYANLLFGLFENQLNTPAVQISVEEPDFFLFGVSSGRIIVRPKRSFMPIVLEQAKVKPLFASLFRGAPKFQLTGKWLNGNIELLWSPTERVATLEIQDSSLASLPTLQALGFEDGKLSTKIERLAMSDSGEVVEVSGASLSLDHISKPEDTVIPKFLLPIPMKVTIPALKDTSLKVQGAGTPKLVQIDDLEFGSNIGRLSGNGRFDAGTPQTLSLKLKGILTEKGFEHLGDYLRMFSNGRVSRAHQPFTVTSQGPIRPAPNIRIAPIESSTAVVSPSAVE